MKRIKDKTPLRKVMRMMRRGDPKLDVLLADYLRERAERGRVVRTERACDS